MLVIFGIAFVLNHCVFRLSPGENAVQSFSACPGGGVSRDYLRPGSAD